MTVSANQEDTREGVVLQDDLKQGQSQGRMTFNRSVNHFIKILTVPDSAPLRVVSLSI